MFLSIRRVLPIVAMIRINGKLVFALKNMIQGGGGCRRTVFKNSAMDSFSFSIHRGLAANFLKFSGFFAGFSENSDYKLQFLRSQRIIFRALQKSKFSSFRLKTCIVII